MTHTHSQRARLSIDVEPELRRKIKMAATERDMSIRDYVIAILQQAIAEDEQQEALTEGSAWGQLSASAFARDWASEADAVYDQLH